MPARPPESPSRRQAAPRIGPLRDRRKDPARSAASGRKGNEGFVQILFVFLISLTLSACTGRDEQSNVAATTTNATGSLLLFSGKGASPGSVSAIKKILNNKGLNYSIVDSSQLNGMSEAQMRRHSLLIVPGGNFEEIGKGLTSNTTASVRSAVKGGLNYLGICAGAFFAGDSPYNGLNLTSGVRFRFYSAEDQGIRKAAVPITFAEGSSLDHYWEDGPQLTGWGAVVGKYPDGTPAIAEGTFGHGRVILSGVHPEAQANWRHGLTFATPAEVNNEYALTLIKAALNGSSLPHY